MDIGVVETHFVAYLEGSRATRELKPFLLVYIELLLFKNEISQEAMSALRERQKQLRGEEFNCEALDELRTSSRKELDRTLRKNIATTRKALLNRMLFCALLDTEEEDLFYLTEPFFEFVQEMKVSADQLKRILESAFAEFKLED